MSACLRNQRQMRTFHQRFLETCAPVPSPPEAVVTGLHICTVNQISEGEAWRREYLARLAPVA